jgi:hypothetical protein
MHGYTVPEGASSSIVSGVGPSDEFTEDFRIPNEMRSDFKLSLLIGQERTDTEELTSE